MCRERERSRAYHIQAGLALQGRIDIQCLEAALNLLLERHEALRTIFPECEDLPHARVLAPEPFCLDLLDISGKNSNAPGFAAEYWIKRVSRSLFSLKKGPLFRASVLRMDACHHILMITTHYMISDEPSREILRQELGIVYSAVLREDRISLETIPIQYRQYAREERKKWNPEAIAGHLRFWKKHLEGTPPHLDMPLHRPRPRQQGFKGKASAIAVPEKIHSRIEAFCQELHIPPRGYYLGRLGATALALQWPKRYCDGFACFKSRTCGNPFFGGFPGKYHCLAFPA